MSNDLKCPICGEPTFVYMGNARKDRLCRKHAKELKDGIIVYCEDCGKFHAPGQCSKKSIVTALESDASAFPGSTEKKCIVCGSASPNGPLCRKCYYEMLEYKDSFDRNKKSFEFNDYYYNLKSNIYRMTTFDYVKSNCNKLMAIASLVNDLFGNQSLSDRAVNDIIDIIEKKKPKDSVQKNDSEALKAKDSTKEEIHRTADGHYVKSHPEIFIDDILYRARIVHCYEKKVPIDADEATITADWFIPVASERQGIYIEYWGMRTKEYLENKERKRKAYKEHDIPLIEIEKDEHLDGQGLQDRIISEINNLAKKYYGVLNFIK